MQPVRVVSGNGALAAFLDAQRMVQQFLEATHAQRHLAQAERAASAV